MKTKTKPQTTDKWMEWVDLLKYRS